MEIGEGIGERGTRGQGDMMIGQNKPGDTGIGRQGRVDWDKRNRGIGRIGQGNKGTGGQGDRGE